MSSTRYATPLVIEPRRSTRLAVYVIGAHTAAAAAVWWTAFWPLALGLDALIVTAGYGAWRRHVARTAGGAVRRLVWRDDHWVVDTVDGRARTAQLCPETYVSRALVVLNLRTGDRQRVSLVLPADGLDPTTFRRLRARLRIESVDEAAKRNARPGRLSKFWAG
ncbi:MAG: hypothetical protein GWO02_22985 [Gammaproteobacteria bacterium]|nr:hypothetical protein [Gammaproteobacteria bacterium]